MNLNWEELYNSVSKNNKELRETIEEMKDYIDELHEESLQCRNEILNLRIQRDQAVELLDRLYKKEKNLDVEEAKKLKCQDVCCWAFHLGCD